MEKEIFDRIIVDTELHKGVPCISHTRIPVSVILELVHADIPFNKIISDFYPGICKVDIQACIGYAIKLIKEMENPPKTASWFYIFINRQDSQV